MGATEIHLELERVYRTQCSLLLKKSRSVTEMTDWGKEYDPSPISWKCQVCYSLQHGKFWKCCAVPDAQLNSFCCLYLSVLFLFTTWHVTCPSQ